jgi:hypothetical protein
MAEWELQFPLSRQPQTYEYVKPEAAVAVFELLMISDVLLEAC